MYGYHNFPKHSIHCFPTVADPADRGNTFCMPSTRAAVQRHTPTPLTLPNPDRTSSEPSQPTPPSAQQAGIAHTNVFSTPSGDTSVARLASPFHYSAAAVTPSSAKLVYTTATAIPTEFRRTHTDDDDATSHASTSTRIADRLYVFRRHERLDLLSRSASSNCPFKRTRVRPLAVTRPLPAPNPGIAAAAQRARRYNIAALHL
jgi:hypothetical protein